MALTDHEKTPRFINHFVTDIFNYEEDDQRLLKFSTFRDGKTAEVIEKRQKSLLRVPNVTGQVQEDIFDCSNLFPWSENLCEESSASNETGKPVYVCSIDYIKLADQLQKVPKRASMVHSLIHAYGLLKDLWLVHPKPAAEDDLRRHHSEDYLELLKLSDDKHYSNVYDGYGLGYDCPVSESTFEYVQLMAGATLTAAQHLVNKSTQIAINWGGGWHHAKRDEASGFCYINDIVLGILHLRQVYDKVLYIDLDLHHGDGVEEAFANTSKVMTVSFHMHEPGFFPGSGALSDIGFGKGKYYSVNVPLKSGIKNNRFIEIFLRVMNKVHLKYKPDAIVCQCGADCLAGDPMQGFNITSHALGTCIQYIMSWKVPTLFLGGGGYHMANTARCWTYLTSVILRTRLPSSIPDNRYFMCYKPGFELEITPGNRPDKNEDKYIKLVTKSVLDNLDQIHAS